jgi:hypothetical protein
VFLLHIPYFYFSYFPSDEALFTLLAQRICSGWALYSETWDYHPPIIIWLYTFFCWFFDGNSLLAIRLLAVFGVYVCGLFLNQLMVNYKFLPDKSLLPAFLFATFASVPWYEFCLNQELLASLLFMVAIIILCRTLIDDLKTWQNFFVIGLILGVCFMVKYHALFYYIIVFSAYVSISAARIREITTMLLGFILSVLAIILIIYFNGSFQDFWDKTVVFNVDLLLFSGQEFELRRYSHLLYFLYLFGGILIFGLLGFFIYRARFYKTIIRQRKFEVIMGIWLIIGAPAMFFSGLEFSATYFLQILPPFIFYFIYFLRTKVKEKYRVFCIIIIILAPIYSHLLFFTQELKIGGSLDRLASIFNNSWSQNIIALTRTPGPLKEIKNFLIKKNVKGAIYIASYHPNWYLYLERLAGLKYLNTKMALCKMDWLPQNHTKFAILSRPESLSDVYRTFEIEKPICIIDNEGIFENIKDRIPILLQDYRKTKIANWDVYVWEQ